MQKPLAPDTASAILIDRVRERCRRVTQHGEVTEAVVDDLMLCAMLEERTAQAIACDETVREFIKGRETK